MQPKHYLILFVAALLEVGGDAVVRGGLHLTDRTKLGGVLQIAAGGIILALYGLFVNTAPLDFSQTLGLYIAFFACVTILGGFVVDHRVKLTTVIGTLIIVAGAVVISRGEHPS